MQLLWNPLQSAAWNRFHRENSGSLQQSWAYGEAMRALGVEVVRVAALKEGVWMACAQFIARRVLGYISLASCSRGPVFAQTLEVAERAHFYRQVRRNLPLKPLRVPLFSPNQALASFNPQELKGAHRVLTGYSTVMIDLN